MKEKNTESQMEPQRVRYLMGNIACAEGAISAGCRFYAGYPITPSSELMEHMSVKLPAAGGTFIQMEDEIASICAVIGASWAGVKAMTATSGPGFSLMMEGLGYAAWTETPCVIVDIQRAGPCTGQATKVGSGDIMQAHYGSHGDYMPVVLSPWSVQEMYDLTIKLFNFSEMLRVPAILMADEAVGHLRENVVLHSEFEIVNRKKKKGFPPFGTDELDFVPPMPSFGEGEKLLVTGSTHDEKGIRRVDDPVAHSALVERIHKKVEYKRKEIIDIRHEWLEDAELVVAAYGFTARAAIAAVKIARAKGKKVGFLRPVTLWPFPDREIENLLKNVRRVLIPEMNMGQVALLLRACTDAEVVQYNQVNGKTIELETIEREIERLV